MWDLEARGSQMESNERLVEPLWEPIELASAI